MAGPADQKGPWPKGVRFSGRTIGKMLSKKKHQGSEHVQLRTKNQIKPTGKARFPNGKYTYEDGSPDIKK